jgi:Fe-S oxidoreductase
MWMEEHIGTRINVTRVEQGLPQQPRVIATACPYCSVMLGDGLKTKNLNETIQTRDVAELVAAAMVRKPATG